MKQSLQQLTEDLVLDFLKKEGIEIGPYLIPSSKLFDKFMQFAKTTGRELPYTRNGFGRAASQHLPSVRRNSKTHYSVNFKEVENAQFK